MAEFKTQLFNIQTAYIRILNEIAFISSYSETDRNKRPFYTVDLKEFLGQFSGIYSCMSPVTDRPPLF